MSNRRLAIVEDWEAEFASNFGEGKGTRVVSEVRCDRCKHWGSQRKNMNRATSQECTRLESASKTDLALLFDFDGGAGGAIVTEPGFGCALFEAKEGT